MKINHFLSRGFLLTALLVMTPLVPLFAEPCSAAFFPSNNITLERNGMNWEYKEQVTNNEAIFFREFIDLQKGNNDNFVNAWEILKAEMSLRDKLKISIEKKPDVKLNGTSETVKAKDFNFWIQKEALGKTGKNSSITNYASVSYSFEKEFCHGTDIWFMGTPESNVTITLPVGFDATRTEGMDNKSMEFENNRSVLKGNFSSEKNITIWLSENKSFAELPEIKENTEKDGESASMNKENKIVTTKSKVDFQEYFGFFKAILTRLHLSPKS